MSVETDKLPPVPQHDPPVDEGNPQKLFTPNWMRWFLQVKFKVDSINASLVALSKLVSGGFAVLTAAGTWASRTITGTALNISVTNGDGVSGNPVINLIDTAVVPGTYGDSSHVARISLDQKGRATSVSSVAISYPTYPSVPTGTGWRHVTAGTEDGAATTPNKSDVGLGNVDNTSDVNKPVSTAQSAAIALKLTGSSGSYTPTGSSESNVTSVTGQLCQYFRLDNTVFIDGRVDVTPTAVGACVALVSLPVASNFGTFTDASGTIVVAGTGITKAPATINASASANSLRFNFDGQSTSAHQLYFHCSYQVI